VVPVAEKAPAVFDDTEALETAYGPDCHGELSSGGVYRAEIDSRWGYDCGELCPERAELIHPEVFGLDCDEYFEIDRPSPAATQSSAVGAAEPQVQRKKNKRVAKAQRKRQKNLAASQTPTAPREQYLDDEAMWDCHLAEMDAAAVRQTRPVQPDRTCKGELIAPRIQVHASGSLLLDRGRLSELWEVSMADILADSRHSEGHDLAWYLNVQNDGLTRTPRVEQAPRIPTLVSNWLARIRPWLSAVARRLESPNRPWYADYEYSWDEEAFSRGMYRDLNLELDY